MQRTLHSIQTCSVSYVAAGY
uniref:Uncharacterized protein n=1 Tax=Arundo donax TaxID=35708 RepID=A0A0A9GK32_ARUDO